MLATACTEGAAKCWRLYCVCACVFVTVCVPLCVCAGGCSVLVITVDRPQLGRREKDMRISGSGIRYSPHDKRGHVAYCLVCTCAYELLPVI